ncbi:MAG: AI-2E family transporter [Alphaproteobacteria bacterium]|jgi:predicted PurR-regulated permease PerM|nr:AI-2E family transporter [Alphaproteobacteria bacterium]
MEKSKFTSYLFNTILIISFLAIARDIVLPFIIAIFFWFLINAMKGSFKHFFDNIIGLKRGSGFISLILSLFIVSYGVYEIGNIIGSNIISASQNISSIEGEVKMFINKTAAALHVSPESAQNFVKGLNFKAVLANLLSSITSILRNAGLVAIYVLFILLEEKSFHKKIKAISSTEAKRKKLEKTMQNINLKIRKWLGIKTVMSIATGVVSYIGMSIVGLNNAEFWAVLIFLLNYIPTFGSIVSSIFPILMALIQFHTLTPFIIVTTFIVGAQIIIGNVIDPKLMGKSLNLSPVVILLSLAAWGSLWGIAGMFLCVPLMAIVMLILSEIEGTKNVARLLSQDGEI